MTSIVAAGLNTLWNCLKYNLLGGDRVSPASSNLRLVKCWLWGLEKHQAGWFHPGLPRRARLSRQDWPGKLSPAPQAPQAKLTFSSPGRREDLQPGPGGAGLQVPGCWGEQGEARHQDGGGEWGDLGRETLSQSLNANCPLLLQGVRLAES